MTITVDEIVVADPPELWADLGFRINDDVCDIGTVRVHLDPEAGKRIPAWSLRGLAAGDAAGATASADGELSLDGLRTRAATGPEREPAAPHPNGVTAVDHVAAFSPDLDRTIAVLEAAGLDLRRIREEPTPMGAPRQAFFRLGEVILECIQMPDSPDLDRSRSAGFWGLALRTSDIERTVAMLGERLGVVRPAVQEGRTIATLRREAGSTLPLAFMSPPRVRSAFRSL